PIRSPALVTTTPSARIGASVGLFRPCSGAVTASASNPRHREAPDQGSHFRANPPALVAPRRSRGAPRFLARRGRVAFDEVPLGVVSLRHFSVTFPGGLALAHPMETRRDV